ARTRVFAGVTRPRTPGLTFGRPKVNRKTAKTKVLDSFSYSASIRLGTSLPLNFILFLIYSSVVNDAPPAGLLKRDMFLWLLLWDPLNQVAGLALEKITDHAQALQRNRSIPSAELLYCALRQKLFLAQTIGGVPRLLQRLLYVHLIFKHYIS